MQLQKPREDRGNIVRGGKGRNREEIAADMLSEGGHGKNGWALLRDEEGDK